MTLYSGFEWMGTWPALIAFGTATVLEVATYYIPWVDNMVDALTTPAAVVAGIIVAASVFGDVPPFLRWSMAIIAGGGVAAIVQGGTVALRAGSSGTTGGMANSLVSTMELVGSILVTVLAIALPILCLVVVIWIGYKMIKNLMKTPLIRKLLA